VIKQTTIEERISAAINNGATSSATIAELLRETEAAIEQATASAEQERAWALDLSTSTPTRPLRLLVQLNSGAIGWRRLSPGCTTS
jgi:hypothetical protein